MSLKAEMRIINWTRATLVMALSLTIAGIASAQAQIERGMKK